MATKNIQQIATDAGDGARAPMDGDIFLGENASNVPFYPTALQLANYSNGQITLDVKAFGAVGDNVTDDSAAIQSALNSFTLIGTGLNGTLLFPPGQYKIVTGLVLPHAVGGMISILGYGAQLITSESIKILSRERPVDNGEAINLTKQLIHIEGLEFFGGTVGLEMSATFGLSLTNIRVEDSTTGIDLIFCLGTVLINCFQTNCVTDGFVARTGVGEWTGATSSNSQSNHTKFIGCRSFAIAGQQTQFKILGCSGIHILDCITEGANTVDAIKFDDEGSTVVRTFIVENLHSENQPSNSVIAIKLGSGLAIVKSIYHQIGGTILVDATGCGSGARIHLEGIAGIPGAGMTLKAQATTSPVWYISMRGNVDYDWRDSANWDGALVGAFIEFGRDAATNSLGIFSSSAIFIEGSRVNLTGDSRIEINGVLHTDQTVAGTTLGSVNNRIAVHDTATGTLIGYLPIYDDIT